MRKNVRLANCWSFGRRMFNVQPERQGLALRQVAAFVRAPFNGALYMVVYYM